MILLDRENFWDSSFAIWTVIEEKKFNKQKEECLNLKGEGNWDVVESGKGNVFLFEGENVYRAAKLKYWGEIEQCIWLLDKLPENINEDTIIYAKCEFEEFQAINELYNDLLDYFQDGTSTNPYENNILYYLPIALKYCKAKQWYLDENDGGSMRVTDQSFSEYTYYKVDISNLLTFLSKEESVYTPVKNIGNTFFPIVGDNDVIFNRFKDYIKKV